MNKDSSRKISFSNYGSEKDSDFIQKDVGGMYDEKSVHQTKAVKPFFENFVAPRLRSGDNVMDIGCGTGKNTTRFLEYDVESVLAIDLSPSMIETAKKKESEKLKFMICDALDLEEMDELESSKNLVFSTHTLHWIEDKKRVFRGVYKLLKPGGNFISTFSSTAGGKEVRISGKNGMLFPPMHAMINDASDEIYFGSPSSEEQIDTTNSIVGSHVKIFVETPEETKNTLEDIGFDVEVCRMNVLTIKFRGKTESEVKKKSFDFYESWVTISNDDPGRKNRVLNNIAQKQWDFATKKIRKDEWEEANSKYYDGEIDFFTVRRDEKSDEIVLCARLECVEVVARKKS